MLRCRVRNPHDEDDEESAQEDEEDEDRIEQSAGDGWGGFGMVERLMVGWVALIALFGAAAAFMDIFDL